MIAQRRPTETNDAVNLIVSLLVRYPEISSVHSNPSDQTMRLTFAFAAAIDKEESRRVADALAEHLDAFHEIMGSAPMVLGTDCEVDQGASFLHVDRDLKTLTKDEISMAVELLKERYGDRLVSNPVPDDSTDEEVSAQDEMVNVAIDSIREGGPQRSLVGFREERRVMIYFKKPPKKRKSARK